MARKPTKEEAGKGTENLLPRPSGGGVSESKSSHRKPRKEGRQRHPKIDAASQAFKSGGDHTAAGGSPSRRGVIYLDADTLKPIKPPVVVARKLERGDFAAGWQAEFGRKLSAARIGVGLSQSDLARRAGVRQPHLSKLEAGEMEPRLSTIFAIADTLGVFARSLFPTMSWQADDKITDL
jgi:DNA-binding XRE family transcriptional regulator